MKMPSAGFPVKIGMLSSLLFSSPLPPSPLSCVRGGDEEEAKRRRRGGEEEVKRRRGGGEEEARRRRGGGEEEARG